MKKIHLEYPQLSTSKNKILIFGKNSTLSKKFFSIIEKDKFKIDRVSRKEINFNSNYRSKLKKKITKFNPDIIVNFIGKFDLNESASKELLLLNILPTWEIIRFFLKKKKIKKINLVIIGSSSYNSPRKKYMLYAASKAGLNSLIASAKEYFKDTQILVKIYNPSTFGGKHIKNYNKKIKEDINKVAKKIYNYIKTN